ncbi:MAG: hypothetical protein ACLPHP_11880 [Candidatus Sulfotelmatobacter sp.]
MLSKCANPECIETFRYLHQGKIFRLSPTPEIQIATRAFKPELQERFWLCTGCAKKITLVWEGTQVSMVPVPIKALVLLPPAPKVKKTTGLRRLRARAASAGREDRDEGKAARR